MALLKSRVFVTTSSIAGLAGAVLLGFGAPDIGTLLSAPVVRGAPGPVPAENAPFLVAEKREGDAPRVNGVLPGNERVQTPDAGADLNRDRSRIRIEAPHTRVQVDPDKGRVRVRAPHVDLDIRW